MNTKFKKTVMESYKNNYLIDGWKIVTEASEEIIFKNEEEDKTRHYKVNHKFNKKIQNKCAKDELFVSFSHTSEDFILRTIALADGDDSFDIFFRVLPDKKQVLIMLEKLRNRGTGKHQLAEELFNLLKFYCLNEPLIKHILTIDGYDVRECKDY